MIEDIPTPMTDTVVVGMNRAPKKKEFGDKRDLK